MKVKVAIPYRPWHKDKVEPCVLNLADDLTRDPMISAFVGGEVCVHVAFDREARRVTFSFAAIPSAVE